jgi:tetrathionate reductase subunit C
MNPSLLYTVPHEASFGVYIALYIFFTGLSAGSFFLSTLSYGFGLAQYRELSRPGIVTATLMLVIAPVFLLMHVGQPFRSWHLFYFLNLASPITWGSFLLTIYPMSCLIYGFYIFRGDARKARWFGLIGIPLAVSVHAYTGFILSFCASRSIWHSSMIPVLFLVSAVASGTALMVLVYAGWVFYGRKRISLGVEGTEMVQSLGRILVWVLILDLVLTGSEILVGAVSGGEKAMVTRLLLSGPFAFNFLGVEIVLGKLIPLALLGVPRLRSASTVLIASALVVAGILFMRLDIVLVGEYYPLV